MVRWKERIEALEQFKLQEEFKQAPPEYLMITYRMGRSPFLIRIAHDMEGMKVYEQPVYIESKHEMRVAGIVYLHLDGRLYRRVVDE